MVYSYIQAPPGRVRRKEDDTMSKTNKELAVELYSAFLISSGSLFANPNFKGAVKFPTNDEMVEQIEELTAKLSKIQNN